MINLIMENYEDLTYFFSLLNVVNGRPFSLKSEDHGQHDFTFLFPTELGKVQV